MKKKTLRVIRICIIVLVLFSLLNTIAAAIVCHSVFARYDAEGSTYLLPDMPPDIKKTPITFVSGKNSLSGRIYDTQDETGLLIIAPGLHSGCDSYLPVVKAFVENGWDVLVYDYTGSLSSEGSWSVGLQQARLDLLSAIEYSSGLPEYASAPIAIFGHSMGGYASATVLADTDRVCAVAAFSAFDNPNAFMASLASDYIGRIPSVITYPNLALYNYLLFGKQSNTSASSVIENTEIPMMVIYGSDDETVRPEYSLYNALLNTADDSTDNYSLLLVDEEYRNRHTGIWLSSESAALLADDTVISDAPSATTVTTAPSPELDEDLFETLLQFYSESAAK